MAKYSVRNENVSPPLNIHVVRIDSDLAVQYMTKYESWLSSTATSSYTRRAYLSRVRHFLRFLTKSGKEFTNVFRDREHRDLVVQDYRNRLRKHLKPTSINSNLAAIDHFFQFIGLGATRIHRDYIARLPPRILTDEEQALFLNAVEQCQSKKDKAIAKLLFHTGIKIGKCAALNVEDVQLSSVGGALIVKDSLRRPLQLPLAPAVADSLSEWLVERERSFGQSFEPALFLNPRGRRISCAGIDLIVRKIGRLVRLNLSAQVLRNTYWQNLPG